MPLVGHIPAFTEIISTLAKPRFIWPRAIPKPSPSHTWQVFSKPMTNKDPRNPYLRDLAPILGLTAVALLAGLILGWLRSPVAWIAWIFFIGLGLTGFIGWLLGVRQQHRSAAFLTSERSLVRWVYSASEWQQIKENAWQETGGDWKIQWGCLTILLGLAGSLTGGMLGIEDGILQIGLKALLGFGVGALFGGLIGGVVAGGNYWAARLAYRDPHAGEVALGPHEIYVNGDYFKGDGVNGYIQGAEIQRARWTTLEFQLMFPPRVRRDPEETWSILIPASLIEKIQEILPELMPDQKARES